MRPWLKALIPPLLTFTMCLIAISWWTMGFSAFTVFSQTLLQAGPLPRAFPAFRLVDQDGKDFDLKAPHPAVLVNFVYLDCPSACHVVNNRLEGIYQKLKDSLIPSKLQLLTISFDLKRDDVSRIKGYSHQLCGDVSGWTFALPLGLDQGELNYLLKALGIWAYPRPDSGAINHSLYLFLVAPDDQIVQVFDPAREEDEAIIAALNSCFGPGGKLSHL